MEIFLGIMAFILGACGGSFVNMLVFRTAERYEITNYKLRITNKDRSYCDFCGRQLRWYENIPIVSWLVLKGRTKCCHNPLPWEYPVVEIGTGVIFLMLLWAQRIAPIQIAAGAVVATLLVFSTVFDLKYMILPDFSTYILISIGILLNPDMSHLLTAAGSFMFLGSLYLITKGKGMGFGDVKLTIVMGLFLGWPKIVVAFYVAFIVGAMVGVVLLGLKIVNKKQPIPFGPFLIFGLVTAYFFGDKILYYFGRWF